MSQQKPVFSEFTLFVRDMPAALSFYRRLGIAVPKGSDDEIHVVAELPGGLSMSFDTIQLTKGYDPGWQEPTGGSRTLLQFKLSSREAVDELFAELTEAGYTGHQAAFDAFWGSRYATINDPDGNLVGFQSPRDPARGGPPPGM